MRFLKYFGFYFLSCLVFGQICYWTIHLLGIAYTFTSFSAFSLGTFTSQPYGSFYQMPSYHWDHPILYWLIMCFSFGLVAAFWKRYATHLSPKLNTFFAILVIPLSIQFASIPATLLWAYHDIQTGREHGFVGSSLEYMLNWLPSGFTLALPLYFLSIPFNVLVTICGVFVLCSQRIK